MKSVEVTDKEKINDLEKEIEKYKKEIGEIKERIFKLYSSKRKSTDVSEMGAISSISEATDDEPNLTILFYKQILEIQCKADESLLTINLPFEGKVRFGFNLKQTKKNKWSLEKACSPYSIDLEYYRKQVSNVPLLEAKKFSDEIQENVYAFQSREEQVEMLKKIMDYRVSIFHCLRYITLELTFKISDTNKLVRKVVKIKISTNLLSIQPDKITVEIKNGSDRDMKNFLEEKFEIFTKTDLIKAYKLAFVDSDKYKFFV